MSNMQQDQILASLDKMIADVNGSSDAAHKSGGPCDLFLEHLRAAKRYLLGSMVGEYRFSLEEARNCASCIPDKNARTETKRILRSLIDPESPSPQKPATASPPSGIVGSATDSPDVLNGPLAVQVP